MRLSSLNLSDKYVLDSQKTKTRCLELSLVIPTYNERVNIEELIVDICHVLDDFLESQYEIIVVDDKSPDNTEDVVQNLTIQYPQVRLISRDYKKGLATAIVAGWETAQGKILGVMDGDLQHPPKTLKILLRAIYEGADLAIASRYLKYSRVAPRSMLRCFLSKTSNFLAKTIFPKLISHLSDPMSGYFLIRYDAIANILLFPLGYKILLEIVAKCGVLEIAEVSFTFLERRGGKTKLTPYQCLGYLFCLAKLRYDTLTFSLTKPKLL